MGGEKFLGGRGVCGWRGPAAAVAERDRHKPSIAVHSQKRRETAREGERESERTKRERERKKDRHKDRERKEKERKAGTKAVENSSFVFERQGRERHLYLFRSSIKSKSRRGREMEA